MLQRKADAAHDEPSALNSDAVSRSKVAPSKTRVIIINVSSQVTAPLVEVAQLEQDECCGGEDGCQDTDAIAWAGVDHRGLGVEDVVHQGELHLDHLAHVFPSTVKQR